MTGCGGECEHRREQRRRRHGGANYESARVARRKVLLPAISVQRIRFMPVIHLANQNRLFLISAALGRSTAGRCWRLVQLLTVVGTTIVCTRQVRYMPHRLLPAPDHIPTDAYPKLVPSNPLAINVNCCAASLVLFGDLDLRIIEHVSTTSRSGTPGPTQPQP